MDEGGTNRRAKPEERGDFTVKLTLEKRSIPHVRGAFVGKKIYLRPATLEDYETRLMWNESADPQRLRQTIEPIAPISRRLLEFEERNRDSADTTQADLTVVNRADDGIIGMLSYRSLNLLNRSARLEVFGAPDLRQSTELVEALRLIVGYLYSQFNLNSVYAEVSELNTLELQVFEALEFKRDGVLRQRHFFDGAFHDIRIYSLLRYETPR